MASKYQSRQTRQTRVFEFKVGEEVHLDDFIDVIQFLPEGWSFPTDDIEEEIEKGIQFPAGPENFRVRRAVKIIVTTITK